ncbi:unnamed protein product [Paramecium primaurelia]|uniref:Uncharacterized protein n=1 Tax=Paramecium primaurelia TaxID=5886 RepID=A0A8S1L8P7_PARPR|nr:unnamed protein product [Paramecium primaurelia]
MNLYYYFDDGSTEFIRILDTLKPEGVFKSFSYIQINFFNFYFLNASREQLGNLTLFKYQNYDYIISISLDFIIFLQTSKKSKHIKKNKTDVHEYTEEKKKEIEKEYLQIKKNNQLQESYEPKIQNVVSTVILKMKTKAGEEIDKLDLDNLAHTSQNCEYKKSRFPALIQRIKEPKSTALIFEAGKMVITGTKGQNEAEEAAKKFRKQIEKNNRITIEIGDIQTSNIVANSQLPYEVNLMKIHDDRSLSGSISYDRSAFPGLIYKMQNPKLAALIFYSGKIVFTGAKNETQIRDAYCQLFNILKKHSQEKANK